MKYLTIEIQMAEDGTVSHIATAHDTKAEAESKFHAVLSYAATSGLRSHACALLDSEGQVLDTRCYGEGE